MGDSNGRSEIASLLDQIRVEHGLQDRTYDSMGGLLYEIAHGKPLKPSLVKLDIGYETYRSWRRKYPAFHEEMARLTGINRAVRLRATRERRQLKEASKGLVYDPDREVPARPSLTDFRWDYLGRPTPIHQQAAVSALEDPTNLVTFIFGPTGMGKDTLAGDFVLHQVAPDRSGLRVAWFMENEKFSVRRMQRAARYLTDPRVYDHEPGRTPGGQQPTASMIEDWGPYRWERGMVYADGSKVERPQWSAHAMYFLQSVAPEADPNLWATGVGGATYGARIDLCVLSDIYTMENQKSPTERLTQYDWVDGTLDTRLDEDGRLVIIGTMLPIENNYERMMAEYIGEARMIREEQHGPGVYRKYSNGVAVVIIEAIWHDADGNPQSYWPERFPLQDMLVAGGEQYAVNTLTDEQILELGDSGAKRVRGLYSRQKRSPRLFNAMFMQRRDKEDMVGDFTEALLDLCDDPTRTYGVVYPTELVLAGADPARTGGAAWAVLALDRKHEIFTVADWWWGQKLGIEGIKRRLIIEPISKYQPSWFAYEMNTETAIMSDSLIQSVLRDFGVSVFDHRTHENRGDLHVGPAAMAAYMRAGQIRFPTQTPADREKTIQLKQYFLAWDRQSLGAGRIRAGRPGHEPDDVVMAIWPSWLKGRQLLERKLDRMLPSIPVPEGIRRRWAKFAAKPSTPTEIKRTPLTAYDAVEMFVGDHASQS